ncbi:ROK family protein [Sinomonas sp. R1AF57]|uniref:ROK family protein n=1 Tax=Sinomonas sp. R1AF57 TaxID=2020377 RepID=UPI000B61094A|nr:ROK family protein [Sinomonas sp. R1AF57]ASN53198.1 transcriptional regulator [Sinomonas sp. R1AF57]
MEVHPGMPVERPAAAPGLAASPGQLLALIRSSPEGISRASLLELTGMARSTLYERLDALFAARLAYEAEPLRSTGGRRARRIRFDDREKVLVAIDAGQTHAAVHLLTPAHAVLASTVFRWDAAGPSDAAMDLFASAARELLAGRTPVGTGLGLPAPVEASGAAGLGRSVLGHWDLPGALARLEEALGCPVVLENDARAMAVGDAGAADEGLVAVKVSTGIGCGIVVDGALVRGAHGAAGDIGHVRIPEAAGRTCRCGRAGCLAAAASGRALLAEPGLQHCRSLADLARAHDAGDPAVLAAVAEAGRLTGSVLAAVVATVNPARVALGGVVGLLDTFVQAVREEIAGRVFEDALAGLEIGPSRASHPIPIGLSRLVMQALYAPARIDALLAQAARPAALRGTGAS